MAVEPPSAAWQQTVEQPPRIPHRRLMRQALLCFVGTGLLAAAATVVLLNGLPSVGTPRSVLLRETRDRVADQLAALFASQAALERVIGAVPAEARPDLLAELCHDNPRLWNILISDPNGRILMRARPMATTAPLVSDMIVPVPSVGQPDLRVAPQFGHSANLAKTPLLLSVSSALGGAEHVVVTVLTRLRDLPSAGASLGRSWLLTDDGILLADRPVPQAVSDAISHASGAADAGDRTLLAPMGDGTHRFMVRRLGGWPASLVMDAGLVPARRAVNDDILAAALALSAGLMLLLGLSVRMRASQSDLHRTTVSASNVTQPHDELAVGRRLASGLAHEVNNLLATLSLDAEQIVALHPSDLEVAALSRSMLGAVGHGTVLTQSLLAFAERLVLRPCVVDLTNLLHAHTALLRKQLQPGQTLICTRSERECLVHVDEPALLASLMALLRNAAEASDLHGEIRIDVVRRLEAGHLMAGLIVDDAGAGMDRATLARVMEPGFSTKRDGRHLGLGLSACMGFARQSGGTVVLASDPGLGTRASLMLPAQPGVLARVAPASASAAALDDDIAKEPVISVLLVDDNEEVRSSIARYLRLGGYHVVEAATEAQALSMIQRGVDIIVTDVVLDAGEDGWALADKARAIKPLLPLVFMSGFMTARQPDLLAGDELASFVRKPVGGLELMAVIAGLLALRETRKPGIVAEA